MYMTTRIAAPQRDAIAGDRPTKLTDGPIERQRRGWGKQAPSSVKHQRGTRRDNAAQLQVPPTHEPSGRRAALGRAPNARDGAGVFADVVDVEDNGEHIGPPRRPKALFVDVMDTQFLGGLNSLYADLPVMPTWKPWRPCVPGVRDERVGIIARREAGAAAAARDASTTHDDEEIPWPTASWPCTTPDAGRSPRGMLDYRRNNGKDEHALPVRQLGRRGPRSVEIIPTADPNGIDGLRPEQGKAVRAMAAVGITGNAA